MPAQPGAQRLRSQGAGLLRDDIAVSEHQGRNASDVISSGQFRFRIGVDLQKPDLGLEFGGDALVDRRHRLAGRAPLRPEVDHHRDVVSLDVGRKALGRDWSWPPREQRVVGGAAFWLVGVFPAWNTVHAGATGTYNVPGLFGHDP